MAVNSGAMPPNNKAPGHDPDVWLFDLDNTLYPARCNLFAQIDERIGRYISDWLKVDAEEARRVQKQPEKRSARHRERFAVER
jgi:putative hydrolase of the HAD superfamily